MILVKLQVKHDPVGHPGCLLVRRARVRDAEDNVSEGSLPKLSTLAASFINARHLCICLENRSRDVGSRCRQ